MAGLFSGVASNALNAATVDYANSLAAGRAANEGLDAMDRRRREAALLQRGGVAPRQIVAPALPGLPGPFTADTATALPSYDVGAVYTPSVGLTPPGGAPAPAPAVVSPTDTPAQPATTSSTPAEPTLQEWNAMTVSQQAAHLKAVNDARGATVAPPPAIGGRYGMQPRPGKPWVKTLSGTEYAATLQKLPVQGRYGSLKNGTAPVGTIAPKIDVSKLSPKLQALVAKQQQATQSPRGKMLTDFAQAVGLNPAAAIATWGMESSFGTVKTKSWAEAQKNNSAYGFMQVMPTTLRGDGGKQRGLLAHFSDPNVLAKYPDQANNINALVQMASGNPDSDEAQAAAGILSLLYSKDIGVPENLQGAAYQADPHAVLKAGAPTGASDSLGKSNSAYSSDWNALFAAQSQTQPGGDAGVTVDMSGEQKAPASVVAGLTATGNSSFDRRIKFVMQKAPAEYDFQTKQLLQVREQNNQLIQQRQQVLEQEQQQLTLAYQNASQRFDAHKAAGDVVGMTAAMDELAATQKLNSDLQNRSLDFTLAAQNSVNEFNNQLIVNEADRAVRDLANGDPRRASLIASHAGGSQVVYQPRSDGGFAKIGPDGKYIFDDNGQVKKFTAADVAKEVYDVADKSKAAALDAGRAAADSKVLESDLKVREKTIEVLGNIKVAEIKSAGDLSQALQTQLGDIAAVKDMPDGSLKIIYKGDSGKIVTLSQNAVQATIDGTEIPKSEISVDYSGIAGLTTTGAPNG